VSLQLKKERAFLEQLLKPSSFLPDGFFVCTPWCDSSIECKHYKTKPAERPTISELNTSPFSVLPLFASFLQKQFQP